MYYLSRAGAPVPAEAPYAARFDEKTEWDYHQQKHKDALKNIEGLVDRRPPKSIQPSVQSIQAHTRRFAVDSKCAEIGRENRKLVDKLNSIARRTTGGCAPPGIQSGYATQLSSFGAPSRLPMPMASGSRERSRSLNAPGERVKARQRDLDNAGMVRRILTVKSSFDPVRDERNYQRHKRAVHLLQRLPEAGRKPRSLPPIRPPRPSSHPAAVRGLEALILPGELQRSFTGPGGFESRQALLDSDQRAPHASTAPAGSLPDPELDSEAASSPVSPLAPAAPPEARRERTPLGPSQQDAAPFRREWLAPSEDDADSTQKGREASKGGLGIGGRNNSKLEPEMGRTGSAGFLGVSGVSELQYADDWDEYSFNSSGNVSRDPSRALSREQSKASNYEWMTRGSVLDLGTKPEDEALGKKPDRRTERTEDLPFGDSKTSFSALPTIEDDDKAVPSAIGSSPSESYEFEKESPSRSLHFDEPAEEKPSRSWQFDEPAQEKPGQSRQLDELEKEKADPQAHSGSSMYGFEESLDASHSANANPGRRPRRNRGQL